MSRLIPYSDNFFHISPKNGFLPIVDPLPFLPPKYQVLQDILDEMPVYKKDGSPGLLATKDAILDRVSSLPNLNDLIKDEQDMPTLCALYRGYTFLTSAYLLESAYHQFKETGKYGKARRVLPSNLAIPLSTVSKEIKAHPWLDYSYSYALGNWVRRDKNKGITLDNLDLAVAFSGTEDERGFILDHVEINSHSGDLIKSYDMILQGLKEGEKVQVISGLKLCVDTMQRMNIARKKMWQVSQHQRYNDFRVFIMGITGNNEIFGDGVIYEGVDDRPKCYSGQTGALDTIIPSLDTFFRVIDYYLDNDLTKYLFQLRNYRPNVFQLYLKDTERSTENLYYAVQQLCGEEGLYLILKVHEQNYLFRSGHWQFIIKYIMQQTGYRKATGGSDIVSYIPNQMYAVLSSMEEVLRRLENLGSKCYEVERLSWKNKKDLLDEQMDALKNYKNNNQKEVEVEDAQVIYQKNFEHGLNDSNEK
jgi:indoleamine 2,3-dioxygenase